MMKLYSIRRIVGWCQAKLSVDRMSASRTTVSGLLKMAVAGLFMASTIISVISACTVRSFPVQFFFHFSDRRVSRPATAHNNCREFVTDGYMENNKWRPRSCRMHYYDKAHIAQCMIRSERARKRRNLFVFIGDSRMREQHQSFIGIAARKDYYNLTAFRCYQSSANFNDDLFDVEFVWNTHMQGFPKLQEWLKNPPAFVAISVGLWHLLGNGANLAIGLNQFKAALRAMVPVLNMLSNVTRVLWMPQAPLIREYLHNHDCAGMSYFVRENNNRDCAFSWKRSDWARAYNDAVYEILKNGSSATYVWMASKHVTESFAFDMTDTMHFMTDCEPPGSRVLPLRSQMLLNFHCNQYIDPPLGSSDARGDSDGELCCRTGNRS